MGGNRFESSNQNFRIRPYGETVLLFYNGVACAAMTKPYGDDSKNLPVLINNDAYYNALGRRGVYAVDSFFSTRAAFHVSFSLLSQMGYQWESLYAVEVVDPQCFSSFYGVISILGSMYLLGAEDQQEFAVKTTIPRVAAACIDLFPYQLMGEIIETREYVNGWSDDSTRAEECYNAVLRQGDLFFVPSGGLPDGARYGGEAWDDIDACYKFLAKNGIESGALNDIFTITAPCIRRIPGSNVSHTATRVARDNPGMSGRPFIFAQGVVTHPQHKTIHLEKGIWYRVYKSEPRFPRFSVNHRPQRGVYD